MNTKDLIRLGVPVGEPIALAHEFIQNFIAQGNDGALLEAEIFNIVANPPAFFADELRAPLARAIYRPAFTPRAELAPWRQWGEGLEAEAVKQMANACALPVAVAGALMPDAHVGYGLPIGGVLATDNAVIPYAVGVDIACRMKLTVYDRKANTLAGQRDRLANLIESETRFGMGCEFKDRREHDVMDEDWTVSPVTQRLHDKAWKQLGTSGSGNHFVEFGAFTVDAEQARALDLEPGEYLALLTHSGSRGTGAQVCDFYSKRAMARHEHLPKELKHLAWLSLDDADGQEYWAAMNLMGRYAAANHALIHKHIAKKLGAHVILDIENHHNFAWKETPRRERRRARSHRASQGRDARGRRRARDHPRLDGVARLRRARQGFARVAHQRVARRGPRDEPHQGDAVLHLERDQEAARRARRRTAQRRPR